MILLGIVIFGVLGGLTTFLYVRAVLHREMLRKATEEAHMRFYQEWIKHIEAQKITEVPKGDRNEIINAESTISCRVCHRSKKTH